MLLLAHGDPLFAGQVERVTQQCKWLPTGIENRDGTIDAVVDSIGVRFLFDPARPAQKSASDVFAKSLRDEGVSSTSEPFPEKNLTSGVLHIIIGSKP
jgi:hypothetical protein